MRTPPVRDQEASTTMNAQPNSGRPTTPATLTELEQASPFENRHIGPDAAAQEKMLAHVGYGSLDELATAAVPEAIRSITALDLPDGRSEAQVLAELRELADRNSVLRPMIGLGYYGTFTPPVILRNVMENPAWYTAYTPYQPEISQGRLEALLNFQTLVADLTGLPTSGSSLLDEGTAAAEAMALARRVTKVKGGVFLVDADTLPQTVAVINTRAVPTGVEVVVADLSDGIPAEIAERGVFGVLLQYPGATGAVRDLAPVIEQAHGLGAIVAVAADLLALTLLKSPGSLGADIACGTSQRFGVPMGFGGPHMRLPRRARRLRPLAARPPGRRLRGHPRQPRLPPGPADPRAAHPPREGHQQHLHRSGAARRDGLDVRRLPRPRRPGRHRPPHPPLRRRAGRGPAGRMGSSCCTASSSTPSPRSSRAAPPRSPPPPAPTASTSSRTARTGSRSPPTRPPPARTWRASGPRSASRPSRWRRTPTPCRPRCCARTST